MDSFIIGISGSENESRAIQIHSIKQLEDANGESLSVRHRDGEAAKIMTAKVMIINVDSKGQFMGIPDGNLAFELPYNMGEIDQDKATELAKHYLQEKEIKQGQDVYYLGILHDGENGPQIDKPGSNTVESTVLRRFEELKREEKLKEEARREQDAVSEKRRKEEFQNRIRANIESRAAERKERKANPSMSLSERYNEEDHKTYISGEITDVRTGDILRLRKYESLEGGKYSGYIDRAPSEGAVECLTPETGDWFKKIDFKIAGMTLMEIAEEGDTDKIRAVSEHLSKLLDKAIERDQKEQKQGEER